MATSLIKETRRGASLKQMTQQQKMFIKHLLADPSFNLTKAAKEAGYSSPRQQGQKLIKHPAVSRAIGKAIKERSESLQFTAEEVLLRLKTILEIDVTEMYDEEGFTTMQQIKDLPDIIRKCITSIKIHRRVRITEDGDKEYYNAVETNWMSKDNALSMALRHFGLMEPEINVHVASDKMKTQVLIDVLNTLNDDNKNVIDTTAISKIASES